MRRLAASLAVLAVLTLAPAARVSAGGLAANVVDHILTVTGTNAGEGITLRCQDGEVTVNQARPGGGPEACSALRRILVFAEGGDDRVSLGDVQPGAFDDLQDVVVDGEAGDDTLIGSGLGDRLDGGGGVDSLRGGDGPDDLSPGPGAGELIGGKGHDTAHVGGDADWSVSDDLIARLGPDQTQVSLSSIESVVLEGGRGDNTLAASSFSGSLSLSGLKGDDLLRSGPGHDRLDGGEGNDHLVAGAGNDLLEGRAGRDVLRGDAGNDQLRGGPGDDTCSGGPGADSELSC